MKKTAGVLLGAWFSVLALSGCDKKEEHEHGTDAHGHGTSGSAVTVPAHYKEAVTKCEELSGKIGSLLSSGNLKDVHGVAEDIKRIAEKIPELAQKEMDPSMLKEVNVKAKELAGMFADIDEAADSGKKEETRALHEKMKSLIADLKKHAIHGH